MGTGIPWGPLIWREKVNTEQLLRRCSHHFPHFHQELLWLNKSLHWKYICFMFITFTVVTMYCDSLSLHLLLLDCISYIHLQWYDSSKIVNSCSILGTHWVFFHLNSWRYCVLPSCNDRVLFIWSAQCSLVWIPDQFSLYSLCAIISYHYLFHTIIATTKSFLDDQSFAKRSCCHHRAFFKWLAESFTEFTLKDRTVIYVKFNFWWRCWSYSQWKTAESSLKTLFYLANP